ncbi:MAG: hypothetical protein ACI90V_006915 [Bacillariaceae sp.]|jgi:hypothetical protein
MSYCLKERERERERVEEKINVRRKGRQAGGNKTTDILNMV